MTITLYTFETAEGHVDDAYWTQNYIKAKEYARKSRRKLIANDYEWADARLVEDFS